MDLKADKSSPWQRLSVNELRTIGCERLMSDLKNKIDNQLKSLSDDELKMRAREAKQWKTLLTCFREVCEYTGIYGWNATKVEAELIKMIESAPARRK
ncbi:MAG: hypothetical protein LBQ03_00530 [Puniceicoccales bacterium]|nr:hypothetical protein [Puniceicoccales bacterium]